MIAFIIYIAEVLEFISFIISVSALIYIVGLFCVLGVLAEESRSGDVFKKINKKHFAIVFIAFFIAALIPSKKTVYLMAGASYTEDLFKTDEAKKVRAIINKKLDDLIKESK